MQALGDTYKWMLYGDDDTIFFVEGVQNLVKDIDPNLPYFITGKLSSCPSCPSGLDIRSSSEELGWSVRQSLFPCDQKLADVVCAAVGSLTADLFNRSGVSNPR